MQIIYAGLVLLVALIAWVAYFLYNQSKRTDKSFKELDTPDKVYAYVNKRQAELLMDTNFDAKDDIEYEAKRERYLRIEDAYTNCVYGKPADVILVKEIIASILQEKFDTPEKLYEVFPLNQPDAIPNEWKWEILLEYLAPIHGKKTVEYLISHYGIDKPKLIENGRTPARVWTQEELDDIYHREVVHELSQYQALSVVATLCYARRGFGLIDTLRRQDIDGINLGAYGAIMPTADGAISEHPATKSVGIFYHGVYIHLDFMDMYSMEECRRIITLLVRYNNPGPLTEKRGYLVNTMEDQSRILAIRPPAAEYWCCFIRKFVLSSHALKDLIDPQRKSRTTGEPLFDENGLPVGKYRNAFIPLRIVRLLMRGQVTTAFTGRQGSGKTTMMTGAIEEVDGRFNIRVLEMSPELYLRELYPERNILSVCETPYVTAAELQDALKKSDAALSIVGEVATDIVAQRMIQMGQVASIFTIFSHHANRACDLVNALTNSIVAASGGAATPATVEPQVIDVIKVDCHLEFNVDGDRYIERITEIMRADAEPYPMQRKGEADSAYANRLNREYYTRVTDRQSFKTHDILRFDDATFTYYTVDWFSKELTKHIMSRLPAEERGEWANWIRETWSGKYDKRCIPTKEEVEEEEVS